MHALRTVAILSASLATSLVVACGPIAAPCANDDECAAAMCVAGRCVERFIGETADDLAGPRVLRAGTLSARPVMTSPDDVPPAEPVPLPPALNADDDEDELESSCRTHLEEHDDAVSGFYRVQGRYGQDPVVVECDMDADGGGWTIIANLARDGCPAGWTSTNQGCDRETFEQIASASFALPVDYSEVRGAARGRSGGGNRAFDVGLTYEGAQADALYVDGLALTVNDAGDQGLGRHLWTFAAGGTDPLASTACPSSPAGARPPSDIVNAFSCDTRQGLSFALWDGAEGDEDDGTFAVPFAPQGDVIEARIMSPLAGLQSRVRITSLTMAVR